MGLASAVEDKIAATVTPILKGLLATYCTNFDPTKFKVNLPSETKQNPASIRPQPRPGI
jgi:hypothetical protein